MFLTPRDPHWRVGTSKLRKEYKKSVKLKILPLSRRPDLQEELASPELMARWPRFMLQDPTANLYFAEGRFKRFFDFMLVIFDEGQPDKLLGRALSVPFAFGAAYDRPELPDGGWDTVVRWADQDAFIGRPANTVSALELTLHPNVSGRGVSAQVLEALKENVVRHGFRELVAPVRPNQKQLEPLTPMRDYVRRTRPDGLPTDSWLRAHVRIGGEIVKVAPHSMVVSGTLTDWREWTGRPFNQSGDITVPGALVPVHVSTEQNYAVYVEPNIWVRHRL